MFNGIDHLTPGPDVLYIVTHSLKSGWRTGAVAALGAACLVDVGGTMLGVRATKSVLNATDSIATPASPTGATGQNDLKKVFAKGFWTHVLNPKVVLFFLAFVPQFIAPDAPHKTTAFLLLGQGMRWLERVAGVLFIGLGRKLALTDNPSH